MQMPHTRHLKIYASWEHLFFTLALVVLPFLFFLVFSRIAQISSTELFLNLGVSLSRMAIAYILAAFFGWVLAVVFSRGAMAAIGLPVFDVLQSFPIFAALPFAVAAWGASNVVVIAALVVTIVWPVFFSIVSSLKLIRRDWEEAAEVYNLKGFAYVRYFLLPLSMPGLMTGSIVGLGDGWEVLIATEVIVGMRNGLGGFFQMFSHNPAITAFGIIGLLIVIFVLNKLIWLRLLEWSHQRMED